MKIGILSAGHLPPDIAARHGAYPRLYADLLTGHGFDFADWTVCDGVFPPSIDAADGWLVSGSKHGAYEDLPWIAPLEAFIRALDADRRPLVGICFGHQIVAQALGGRVEKFAGGWSVGRRAYVWGDDTWHLNGWHQDQVVAPPAQAQSVASSDVCRHAALAYGDHILTVQPHPEFSAAFTADLIESRGRGVVPDAVLARAEAALDLPLDNRAMGDRLGAFLKQAHARRGAGAAGS
ncbi:type 1 glutamine amidotransferase [Rhodobacteraceae bacterium CCMM004]|nr:type 1 glutamine amidotransferase [Rhodobacteraceae bacterium CCMM004]